MLAACALIPCSCKTMDRETTASSIPQGMAIFDAVPEKKHATRICKPQIVALNGRRLIRPARSLELNPGDQEVTVQFEWPDGGTTETDVVVPVVADRRYSVRYWPYPHDMIDATAPVRPLAVEPTGSEADIFILAGFLATRAVEESAKYAAYKGRAFKDSRKPATHADIAVISSYQPEGVVCMKRVTP
jgi:hypothetical protein